MVVSSIVVAPGNASAKRAKWKRVHQKSADRFYDLAVQMRGGLIKIGQLIHALRVATTGKAVGFGMFEILEILQADQFAWTVHIAQWNTDECRGDACSIQL